MAEAMLTIHLRKNRAVKSRDLKLELQLIRARPQPRYKMLSVEGRKLRVSGIVALPECWM